MYKKLMAVLVCMSMAFAVSVDSAHAGQPEGKGRGNTKEKVIKSQGRSENNQGSRARGNRKQGRQQNDTYSGFSLGISDLQARELARGGSYTGYQALPPGIAKNVARGKPLPPGIAKKSVPADMMPGLPVHPGYQWQVLGRDLVLVQDGSNVIADILRDVFR